MSLYPSLEDMKVDHLMKAQMQMYPPQPDQSSTSQPTAPPQSGLPYPLAPGGQSHRDVTHLFPDLSEYMGQEFTSDILAVNMPEYVQINQQQPQSVAQYGYPTPAGGSALVAPITSLTTGLQKAQVTHGVREVTVCKDADHKVGIRVKSVNNGIFICMVKRNSPAAMVGLRFGDQILQINGDNVATYSMDKVHGIFKKLGANDIVLAVRDRPFERTVTLHKDSTGHIGFQFQDGMIHALVKDSSAARNGLLTDHQMLEVNGQNVVGLKDKEVTKIVQAGGQSITVTVMPTFVFKLIIKHMDASLLTKLMDHSIPDI